ncbi:DUF4855 domain-containing protein [Alteribacter lacisalsi]|nr:DUF4855 domain-containing protein [Alteribacter lacisalsi]
MSGGTYLSARDHSMNNHLAVLMMGKLVPGTETVWNPEELRYYLTYVLNGKSIDTLFGGLIFNPVSGKSHRFIHPMYAGYGESAEKQDWDWVIDELFRSGRNIDAAQQAARTKTDIWVCLPYPGPGQRSFGRVNGKVLDFTVEDDRYAAVIDWADRFLARWKEEEGKLTKLTFRGFVWQREAILLPDRPLVTRVNAALKNRKVKTIWLPNYGSAGVIDWKERGFDLVGVNPNYYGNTDHDLNWMRNTAVFTKHYGMGLQINYGKGYIFNDTHLLDYLNLGTAEQYGYQENCFMVYQLHQRTMKEAYEKHLLDYIRIYSFTKNIYQRVHYPGIAY